MLTAVLFAFTNSEHFGAARRTHPLGSRSAVFHRNLLGIFHFFFGFAFHTVSLHLVPPYNFFKSAKRFTKSGHCAKIVRDLLLKWINARQGLSVS
jgi:hypothetical protein